MLFSVFIIWPEKTGDCYHADKGKQFHSTVSNEIIRKPYGHGMKRTYFTPQSWTPLCGHNMVLEWEDKNSSPPSQAQIRKTTPTMRILGISTQRSDASSKAISSLYSFLFVFPLPLSFLPPDVSPITLFPSLPYNLGATKYKFNLRKQTVTQDLSMSLSCLDWPFVKKISSKA